MSEERDFKFTDLDFLVGNHHLQMMKAALPFLHVSEQKMLSVLVKLEELHRTIDLFQDQEVATVGICSVDKTSASPLDMLNAIKPYGTTYEQDMIDVISNFIQGARISNAYQETAGNQTGGETGNTDRRSPLEQIKNILPPEQQSRLETVQLLMQAMSL